jgi:cation:H+ antiporter
MILELLMLVAGLILLIFSSEKTVEHSVKLAKYLKVSPLIIGIVLISIGTDVPEITNSIISSYLGHGDINVGSSFGSPLSQITLVLGIAALASGRLIKVRESVVTRLGIATLGATLLGLFLVSDGNLTRADAAALIVSYIVFLIIIQVTRPKELGVTKVGGGKITKRQLFDCSLFIGLSILGVIIGSMLVVNSVIVVSNGIGIPEFIISFFLIGLGTSLPELAVTLSAVRRGEFGLAIGNAFGSNITDLTLALASGPLLFPTMLTKGLVNAGGLYLIGATALVVALLGWRKRIGKAEGVVLVLLYLGSFVAIPLLQSL